MSRCGRETLPDIREWFGVHPGCSGVVGRPSRMTGSSWDTFRNVREWSVGPPGYPGVVGRFTRMTGSG